MKTTIHKTIHINAPRAKVWDTMLDDATYRQWTASFCPGSYYKGSWQEGSKMLFLGPNPETGVEGGLVSYIKENRLHEFISIEHVGLEKAAVELENLAALHAPPPPLPAAPADTKQT